MNLSLRCCCLVQQCTCCKIVFQLEQKKQHIFGTNAPSKTSSNMPSYKFVELFVTLTSSGEQKTFWGRQKWLPKHHRTVNNCCNSTDLYSLLIRTYRVCYVGTIRFMHMTPLPSLTSFTQLSVSIFMRFRPSFPSSTTWYIHSCCFRHFLWTISKYLPPIIPYELSKARSICYAKLFLPYCLVNFT